MTMHEPFGPSSAIRVSRPARAGMNRPAFSLLAALALAAGLVSAAASASGGESSEIAGLNVPRAGHTGTRLAGGGILIAGGENAAGVVRETEIFDPSSCAFVSAGQLDAGRADHTATRLSDDRIFLIGGRDSDVALASTEIGEADGRAFRAGPALQHARYGHTATLLPDGRIVVAGGDSAGTIEVFEPGTGVFRLVGARLSVPREFHAAALLSDGRILFAGGIDLEGAPLASAELLDVATMTILAAASDMRTPRSRFTLNVLPDGKVQAIGGDSEITMEMFNPEGRYFTARAQLVDAPGALDAALKTPAREAVFGRAPLAESLSAGERTRSSRGTASVISPDTLDRFAGSVTRDPAAGFALAAGGVRSAGLLSDSALLTGDSSATVTTDKTDYSPGETVVITGTGWQPSEVVSMSLHEDDGDPDTMLSAVADENGGFVSSDFTVALDDGGVTFLLTATGETSGYTAQTTFTDSGSFNYSPSVTQNLTAAAGGAAVSFSQDVTAPAKNDDFSASLQVSGTGVHPIPAAWVSTAPSILSFSTGSGASGHTDLKTWTVSFTVPAGTAANTYTANIKANASISGVGAGSGTPVSLVVTACSSPSITTCPPAQQADASVSCQATVPDFTASTVVSSPGCAATVTQSPTAGTIVSGAGAHTVTITATNASGNATCTTTFTVLDVTKPVITITGSNPATVECHTSYTDGGATANDTCAGGLSVTPSSNVDVNVPGAYSVTYTATDPSGNTQTATRVVNVADSTPPVITLNGASSMTIECHTSFTDPGATANDSCAGSVSVTPGGSVDANTPGTYTLTYDAVDPSGNHAVEVTRTVHVADSTPPMITVNGSNPVTVICHTTYNDAGASALDSCAGAVGVSSSGSVDVNTVGTYTITYAATDPAGNTQMATRTVNVTNVAPVVDSVTGPPNPVPAPSTVTVTANFTDPDPGQTHTCTFTWDDPSNPTSVVTVAAGATSCSASHTYASASVNTVSVDVSDGCATSAAGIFQFVVVYDPNAGFVTGGGFINSMSGAYVADPSLVGKANFGFVSKYQKGAKVPTGETEFQFQVANFNFHSGVYEWLVISGALAQYKGTGTVNGSGNYGFLLTATDGQVSGGGGADKFRIKIWDNDAGGAIVYDNRLGSSDDINSANPQAIAGGSIVIHKN
jgi:hypothetical protein